MLEWDDRYKIGEESIDSQHKLLFAFFNDFEVAIREKEGRAYCEECFTFLEHYAKTHFGNEEGCMNRHKCPIAAKNKIAHEQFITAFHGFNDKLHAGGYSDQLMIEMHQFLETWITSHIMGIDLHLKSAIEESEGSKQES